MRNLIPRQELLLKRINLHNLNYRKQIKLKLTVGLIFFSDWVFDEYR